MASQNQNQGRLEAAPALASYLSVQQQLVQQQIAADVAAGMLLLWPIIAFNSVDATSQPWLHAAMLQVQSGFDRSARVAAEFVQNSLWAVEPEALVLPDVPVDFPAGDVARALMATGPGGVKSRMPAPEEEVMPKALADSTGAGVSKAMDGGRSKVIATVRDMAPARKARRRAIGWARVTDNDPCYFCGLLASQGAFYVREDSFKASNAKFVGDGVAKVHDHCRCSLRPVYSTKDDMDERANYFLNQWNDAEPDPSRPGDTKMKAYRRNFIAPPDYRLGDVLSLDERRNIVDVARRNRDVLLLNRGLREDSPQVLFWEQQIIKLGNLEAV